MYTVFMTKSSLRLTLYWELRIFLGLWIPFHRISLRWQINRFYTDWEEITFGHRFHFTVYHISVFSDLYLYDKLHTSESLYQIDYRVGCTEIIYIFGHFQIFNFSDGFVLQNLANLNFTTLYHIIIILNLMKYIFFAREYWI